jgi:hypothetical protein
MPAIFTAATGDATVREFSYDDAARGRTTGPVAGRRLDGMDRLSGARGVTIAGLVVGAAGIAILWAAGQEFPIYPPPGIVLLLASALFNGLTSWRWSPAVGAVLGAFVTVGTLISPAGLPNLTASRAPRSPSVRRSRGSARSRLSSPACSRHAPIAGGSALRDGEAGPYCEHDQLCAVPGAQLDHRPADVGAYGGRTDRQLP